MDWGKLSKIYSTKKGGIIGAGIGVAFAVSVMWIGLFSTVFIVICACIGYYAGIMFFQGKSFIKAIIDKIIRPGTYR